MMPPIEISELQIVGYGEVLPESMLPSIVPPVFQHVTEPARFFLPPFHLASGAVFNATEVGLGQLKELRDAEELTMLPEGTYFPAQRDHELWVDRQGVVRYEPFETVRRQLHEIFEEAQKRGQDALRAGDLDSAKQWIGIASCADDRQIAPVAMLAAVRRIEGSEAGESLMTKIASRYLDSEQFRRLVDYWAGEFRAGSAGARPIRLLPVNKELRTVIGELENANSPAVACVVLTEKDIATIRRSAAAESLFDFSGVGVA